jgi:hypothetical protein
MSDFRNILTHKLIDDLAEHGERIIRECENERTYEHRTKNLHDSYGYGVYSGGTLVRHGFLCSAQATKGKNWYGERLKGRDEITQYLQSYKSEGIELVIVVAMPYGEVLENGGGRYKYHQKYKVISMSYDKLSALKAQYPHSLVSRIIHGKKA